MSKIKSEQAREKMFVFIEQLADEIFLNNELPILDEKYDLKIVNFGTSDGSMDSDVALLHYDEQHRRCGKVIYTFKACFDYEFWKEAGRVIINRKDIINRLKFVLWFYIEAQEQFFYLKKILKFNHKTKAIFYCYWNFVHCFAITSNRWRYPNIKVISRIHGYDLFHYRMTYGWQPFKQAMDRRIDKMVFAADYSMEYYLSFYGIKKQAKHALYYLGTNNEYALRKYHKKDTFRIVSCATTIALKRIHLIIEALSMIENLNVEWVHFGGGDLYDELRSMASDYLNKENIKWEMRGDTDNREILAFYNEHQVDCFITTTETEGGSPVSIMEAMSYAIPIIATDVTSLPYMINGNGIIISQNPTGKEIVDAICKVAEMTETELEEMRNNSRRLWEEKYVAEKNAQRFVNEVMEQL